LTFSGWFVILLAMKFEFNRSYRCSRWYLVDGENNAQNCLGVIEKWDDRGGDINPYKVSVAEGGDFKPKIAFWPNAQDVPTTEGGYFEDRQGNLADAKRFLLTLKK
jgi:hypothetical protein